MSLATRLHSDVWRAIYKIVQSNTPHSEFAYGKVTGRNEKNRTIFVDQFGDIPIPMVGFNFEFDYYDSETKGNTPAVASPLPHKVTKRTITIRPQVPKIGQTAVMLRHYGVRRLPKCIGIIQSTNFVLGE